MVVEEKCSLLKTWKDTKNVEDKKKYNAAKYRAKKIIGRVLHEQKAS